MIKVMQFTFFNYTEKVPTPIPGAVFQFCVIVKPKSGWVSRTVYVYGSKDGLFLELNTARKLEQVFDKAPYQITHWAQLPDPPADHYFMFNQENE